MRREILTFQEFVLWDSLLEQSMKSVRQLLREMKGKEASLKILNILEYSDSFDYRMAKRTEEVEILWEDIQRAFTTKSNDDMCLKAEHLVDNL